MARGQPENQDPNRRAKREEKVVRGREDAKKAERRAQQAEARKAGRDGKN